MPIQTHIDNHVLTITFNRIEKKNAITSAMYISMAAALRAAETDDNVRVIVFKGHQSAFTAGNDLEDFMKTAGQINKERDNSAVVQFMQALLNQPKPVIAAVSGLAIGIGTTMLMHCDLVYLADNAKLSMPFSHLGLCAEYGSSYLLPRLAGYHKAAEKLLLGEPFTATEALQMGLANQVLPVAELDHYVAQQAAKLVALPASSLRATKRLMKASPEEIVQKTIQTELTQFGAMLFSPEAREAFSAFFEKRKPDFSQFG